MAENTTEVLVGGCVLAAAAGFLFYAGQITGYSSATEAYTLNASFRSVEGVSVGTDIRMAGVKIGTVVDLALNQETFRADAVFAVVDGVTVPDDSSAEIASEGLLGGNYVDIVPGGSPFNFDPGATIVDTQGAVSLVTLLAKFAAGSGSDE
ncbi:outer membrane lipid asymmetry maintenance protein MlaD [Cochlodiniinecator piscidefendens]|uniref:outer membrane lipid asymmetry maintenance protein MlaD n=1 Tax=Cochlodiniinecator piscidefendens TaxID=2715756 RepID=UPI00140C8DA0|nr:outer membrane lipid asymmetry maintenance protein MlaD [Cochlodiniinecator piscidefendens]